MGKAAIYYEHPEWFKPLFSELEQRSIDYEKIHANRHQFDMQSVPDFSLLVNRMSPSAHQRGGTRAIFHTLHYLRYLEQHGITVVNGSRAYAYEISKVRQMQLLRSLGLAYPKSRVVNDASLIPEAAQELRFPVVTKANVGGSGAGIARFDRMEDIQQAVADGNIDLGVDHTALVQEFIPARGGRITRVETLGGSYLYAIHVATTGEDFNLCPLDICHDEETQAEASGAETSGAGTSTAGTSGSVSAQEFVSSTGTQTGEGCIRGGANGAPPVEAATPPGEVIANVESIVRHCGMDLAGVEYIVDDRDGQIYYYDINAMSNFVANANSVIGFNPYSRLVDYLERRLEESQTGVTG